MRTSISACLAIGLLAGSALRARAADREDPRAIIAKAIRAMGGEEKLAKYKSAISKGTCRFFAGPNVIDCTADWWVQPPRQLKSFYHMKMGARRATRLEVIDNDRGWHSVNGEVTPINAAQLDEIHEGMEAQRAVNLLALKDPSYQLTMVDDAVVAGRPATGIKVAREGHRDVMLYFDKEHGYVVKMQTFVKNRRGNEVDSTTVYSDYHDYDGIRNANRTMTLREGQPFLETRTTEFKAVEKIPDSEFAEPLSRRK